jgi:hypothetical protein
MRYVTTVFAFIAVCQSSARAGEIILNMLGNAADQSAIAGTCTYEKDDSSLHCQTVLVTVTYALDKKDFSENWKTDEKFDKYFAEVSKADKDFAKMCRSGSSDVEAFAEALKHPTDEQKSNLAIAGPVKLQQTAEVMEFCKHPTRAAFRQLAYNSELADTKQCRIQVSLPDIDVLQKVNANKWISVPGPSGLCHVVGTSTLERTSEDSLLWTWTDVASTADDNEGCRKVGVTQSVNKPLIHSWRSGPIPMHCETVSFGQ